ncbi:MAG: PIN domain-containing protein [Candidatus Nanopelagicales bacterium]|nr:PIN domain-containing protein [Candidatus Nanopelagicales bacterium]
MTALPDVNVLVALLDPGHEFHDVAHRWFGKRTTAWATCPLTENGTIRVISHPRYPNSTGTASAAADLVRRLCELPGHVFWPDAVSLLDPEICDLDRLTSSGQVTDSYLLALAVSHAGSLVTFDKRLVTMAIPGGDTVVSVLS